MVGYGYHLVTMYHVQVSLDGIESFGSLLTFQLQSLNFSYPTYGVFTAITLLGKEKKTIRFIDYLNIFDIFDIILYGSQVSITHLQQVL